MTGGPADGGSVTGGGRAEILRRVRTALAGEAPPPPVVRDYRGADEPVAADRQALVELFADRLRDYQATVLLTEPSQAPEIIAGALADRGAHRIVIPAGFPGELSSKVEAEVSSDDPPLSIAELDQLDGVLTSCAVAIAETGTIVLDATAGQGRRALSLVPDYHLVVVRAEQIVASVPEAIALVTPRNPLTWISGPSATSDIELSRVEGVHGPRTLVVVILN